MKIPDHKQYKVPEKEFDSYNKESPIQDALGSKRVKERKEASDIRSTNWKPGISGWRLTPSGLELGNTTGVFPPGMGATGSFTTEDWTVTVSNGLITAIVTRHSLSPSLSPSVSPSPSLSPSKSPSVSPSPSLSPSISPSVSPS